jgi:hypothetical protein
MMNPKHYYHTPVKPVSTRASCPVCHEAVYSRAGIHPQCAVIQYDPPKIRSKKQQAHALLDEPIEATDPPVPVGIVDPPIVKLTPADPPILPSSRRNALPPRTKIALR